MYAKLVAQASGTNPLYYLRDIGRLLTSNTPNTSILTGFSSTSSVVYDDTPAGWTYVGSTNALDRPTIADASVTNTNSGAIWNFCFSAPCLSGDALKYLVLNCFNIGTQNPNGFTVIGASNATSLGVLTNPTPRFYVNAATSKSRDVVGVYQSFPLNGQTFYIIANQRHCTIICENTGMTGLWESSMTNAHTFYGVAPFVMMQHYSGVFCNGIQTNVLQYDYTSGGNTPAGISVFTPNVTNPNNGTNYGIYDVATNTAATLSIAQTDTARRANTIDASGNPKYVVSPIYYSMQQIGYPTQYVTGIVPIYWTAGGMGTSGDTVSLNDQPYTFFNVSTKYGVIIDTSAA